MLKHRKENLNAIKYTKAHRKSYKNVEKIYFLHIANTKAISNFRILKTKAFLGVDKGCLLC